MGALFRVVVLVEAFCEVVGCADVECFVGALENVGVKMTHKIAALRRFALLSLRQNLLISTRFLRLKIGCGTWGRTKINGSKIRCPTIRRSRNYLACFHKVLQKVAKRNTLRVPRRVL